MMALTRDFALPGYLLSVMRDYLSNRWLLCETEDGLWTKEMSARAAQGSGLGPDL